MYLIITCIRQVTKNNSFCYVWFCRGQEVKDQILTVTSLSKHLLEIKMAMLTSELGPAITDFDLPSFYKRTEEQKHGNKFDGGPPICDTDGFCMSLLLNLSQQH